MEADIFIWQKPGHSYFALTRTRPFEADTNESIRAPIPSTRLASPIGQVDFGGTERKRIFEGFGPL